MREKQRRHGQREAATLKEKDEREVEFLSEKVELEMAMENFARINRDIQDVVMEASDVDKRHEWEKLEDEASSLRKKLVALGKIDPMKDMYEIQKSFDMDVETPFSSNRKFFMTQLKGDSMQRST